MKLSELAALAADEHKAEAFLQSRGLLQRFTHCPYCGSEHLGRVRRRFYKCYACRREWSLRKGSLLEGLRLPLGKFLLALKLFELEVSARRAARELGLAYNTVHRLFLLFRERIYRASSQEDQLSGEVEMDESYFGGRRRGKRGRGAAGKLPVFGILERGGKVKVEVVPDVRAETLLREAIAKVKRGSLIYTDRFRSYDGLVCYGFRHERIDHGERFANGKVYINGIEGFWSYAKERLQKYHGLSALWFPLYLKELEFRYNHRKEDLFEKLLEVLKGGMN